MPTSERRGTAGDATTGDATTGDAGAIDPARLAAAVTDRYPEARERPKAVRVLRAPGRVNLIGEHTDYNMGFVLPVAIDLEVRIASVPTDDRRVEMTLLETGETAGFSLDAIGSRRGGWIDYVAGTAWSMVAAGTPVHGFRGVLASTLPRGAGLSSSAALELASAWALAGGGPPALDGMTLARIAQRGENEYVGVRCGLMDQFASALGVPGGARLLDCRSLEHRPVLLPLAKLSLVVCHSGSPRRLEASAYNERRAECERAVSAIAAVEPAVRSLRDVDLAMLERYRSRLDPIARARAWHVVTENDRVLATEAALRDGDFDTVGRLFAESHQSLRDRFAVSSDALDALVAIAAGTEGVVAARLTGAGFGGCTVNLVRRERVAAFRAAIEQDYPRTTGLRPTVYEVEPVGGAGLVS